MVTFIGAGPGDPELITVKGQKRLADADVVIYAGSLVNPEILTWCRPEAVIHNSASLSLEQVIALIGQAVAEGKKVARVHTGDPSIYGAIREQMDVLDELGIAYEVIPGVSSFLASAAAVQKEFTLPGVSQTVIITRLAGRTPVPERESLRSLAQHQASLCIFLSTAMIGEVVAELRDGGYSEDTPVAVVYKASWPEQKIVQGTLADIADKVQAAKLSRTAMIMVGRFLEGPYERSLLYDPTFSHGYRQAVEEKKS
ncbi:precorrin-4 C(11)-methyltransferase [Heliophilum fasciatum]|uniref:Cobalt-precorrin 4 C11-methyltransferase n=1 Tax=Heliophilum fasciatum TaxID=35700 RepID=A0A4R2RMI2_9FIRM|nr:precorrin-4 C(11)-methyltransferase [Heliophilum fasciatum]MCW2278532.1 precorrin-4/cobalt-precorrin-4 C11-methyltransferase [Heliophilum fasciatum]TCP63487.1 cobalt-precorrin 4 C11-methyltransferase [Heliophilum fasciatum]